MFDGQEKKYGESKISPEQRRASEESAKMEQYGRVGQTVHVKCEADYPKKMEIGEIIEVYKQANDVSIRITNGERTGEIIKNMGISEWEPLAPVE
ncbi:MAG: hypothetical protein WCX17_02100 [Parcubacteria group bacterium]|jgi:hypothetical protein